MLSHSKLYVVALMLLAVAAPAAAQYVNPDTCSWSDPSCAQANRDRDAKNATDSAARETRAAEEKALRQKLARLPLLPKEQNVLLGSWRLEDDGQRSARFAPGDRSRAGGRKFRQRADGDVAVREDVLSCIPGRHHVCAFNRFDQRTLPTQGRTRCVPQRRQASHLGDTRRASLDGLQNRKPESHTDWGILCTGAGRVACGQCRGERRDCARQRTLWSRKFIGTRLRGCNAEFFNGLAGRWHRGRRG